MDYKDIVALYFERSNEMQSLWTFYLAVCVIMPLLVGFMRPSMRRIFVAAVLSFAFAVIAAVNLTAVIDISNVRLACRELIRSGALPNSPGTAIQMEIAKGVQPPALAAVIAVQIGGDLLTLGTLWYLAFSRRDSAQSPIGRY